MSFNPNEHLLNLKGKAYLPVAARIVWFRQEHPDWGIITEPVEIDWEKQRAVFRATILNEDGRIIATATKTEDVRGFGDFLEKAETGSIGRALALCGYGTQFAPEFDEGERLADSPQAIPALLRDSANVLAEMEQKEYLIETLRDIDYPEGTPGFAPLDSLSVAQAQKLIRRHEVDGCSWDGLRAQVAGGAK